MNVSYGLGPGHPQRQTDTAVGSRRISCAADELAMFAIVVPICSDASIDLPDAVLIIGLSPYRPFDHDYEQWINVIRSQLNTGLVSVKTYEEEARRVEDLARMEKAKTAWFRGAAHDLRSPLTLVKGPIDDLLDSDLNPSQKNSAQMAKRNVDRLLRLINTLMDFTYGNSYR